MRCNSLVSLCIREARGLPAGCIVTRSAAGRVTEERDPRFSAACMADDVRRARMTARWKQRSSRITTSPYAVWPTNARPTRWSTLRSASVASIESSINHLLKTLETKKSKSRVMRELFIGVFCVMIAPRGIIFSLPACRCSKHWRETPAASFKVCTMIRCSYPQGRPCLGWHSFWPHLWRLRMLQARLPPKALRVRSYRITENAPAGEAERGRTLAQTGGY